MIPTLGPNQLLTPASGEPTLARLLPAGGQLAATVLQSSTDTSGTRLQLQLHRAGQILELNSPRPLPAGSTVVLSRNSAGQLQLNLAAETTPRPPATSNPATATATLDSVLRTSLPRQQSFGDVLNQLLQQAQAGTAASSQAARQLSPVVQSLLQIFGITPGLRDSGQAVRRNIEKGGFFTEASLGRAAAQPANAKSNAGVPGNATTDLKAQMGQLQQLADALPPQAREQMHKLLGDLLARITSSQLNSASQNKDLPDGTSERHLALDLPVRLGERMENVELRLKRYRARRGEDPASSHWLVRLHFDLQALGPLEAELRLRDDNRMSARFWTQEPETARLIEQRLPEFASNLDRQGIEVDDLGCHQGTAPRGETGIRRQLINLKT
uniref:flagellar hook-length control protein FliK n=1 Tax=Marinobacterium profundum TaxID=1714300 RepID=UPI000AD5F753|nr:flagellar hook-length control protein FliK [Marinobacterium profundum]